MADGIRNVALTGMQIRSARPKIKDYKLWDERGLFLVVKTNGTKLWRFRYRVDGIDRLGKYKKTEKALSFGMYPDVSLQRARILRDEARSCHSWGDSNKQLQGIEADPARCRDLQMAAPH